MTDQHHAADPPSRATGSVIVSFGMVSIPVNIYTGIESGKNPVPRNQFSPAGNPIGMRRYDSVTGEEVDADAIVKKAVASTGERVDLTDDEIAQVTGGKTGTADIETFVPLAALADGTYIVDNVHQMRPAPMKVGSKKLPNPGAEKAFGLLLAVMAEAEVAALFKVAQRGPAQYAALTPDGRMLTLAWSRQVRQPRELTPAELADAELEMGRKLLATVGVATPVLEDHVGAQLQEFVDAKAAGQAPEASTETQPEAAVVDLTAALAQSLAAAEERADELAADTLKKPARKRASKKETAA